MVESRHRAKLRRLRQARSGRLGCLGRVGRSGCGLLIALVAVFLVFQVATWPNVEALATDAPETTAFIEHYKATEIEAGRSGGVARRWVAYSAISKPMKRAVLVAEDIDFFSHDGFATEEMKIAIRAAVEEGKPLRGASTISQQLVKNLWLSPSRNPWRKLKEALLTRQLEARLSKHRILELYLNSVEFGRGIYGVEAAARHYFGKSAAGLTPRESAALAASLPNPKKWHPGSTSGRYQNRVRMIERRAAKAGWLDGET